MGHLSSSRSVSLGATLAFGAVGLVGSTVLMSGPAAADPKVPENVWVQCSGFSGPAVPQNQAATDTLSGCTSRSGDNGSGTISRPAGGGGTETIRFNRPFEGGKSLQLTGTTSKVV